MPQSVSGVETKIKDKNYNKYLPTFTLSNFPFVVPKSLSAVHFILYTQKRDTSSTQSVPVFSHVHPSTCVFTLHSGNLIAYPPSPAKNILNICT